MVSHLDMARLANDPRAVAALARSLLEQPGIDWSDWEQDFLASMAERRSTDALSSRQREKLVELRDDAQSFSKIDGFSVAALVRRCYESRLDLGDDDEAFICDLHARTTTTLKRRPLLRLLRCARQTGVIESYVRAG